MGGPASRSSATSAAGKTLLLLHAEDNALYEAPFATGLSASFEACGGHKAVANELQFGVDSVRMKVRLFGVAGAQGMILGLLKAVQR